MGERAQSLSLNRDSVRERRADPQQVPVGIHVDELAEAVGRVSRRLEAPGGTASRFVCFKDPDGTVLELVELAPGRAPA